MRQQHRGRHGPGGDGFEVVGGHGDGSGQRDGSGVVEGQLVDLDVGEVAQLPLAGEAGQGVPAAPREKSDVPAAATVAAGARGGGRGGGGEDMVVAAALPPRHVEGGEGGHGW